MHPEGRGLESLTNQGMHGLFDGSTRAKASHKKLDGDQHDDRYVGAYVFYDDGDDDDDDDDVDDDDNDDDDDDIHTELDRTT